MKQGAISAGRYSIVATYALASFLTVLGGISAGEFVTLFIIGIVCLVTVLSADWINEAARRDDRE